MIAPRPDQPRRPRSPSGRDACRQFAAELVVAADEIARRLAPRLQVRETHAGDSAAQDVLQLKRDVYEFAARIIDACALSDDVATAGQTTSYAGRWTPQRKLALVMAARSGRLSMDEIYRRYSVPAEEIADWTRAFNAHGLDGLKVTNTVRLRRKTSVPAKRRPRRD